VTRSVSHSWAGYADAWRAEFIKVRTLVSTAWLLAATIVLGVGLGAAATAVVRHQTSSGIQLAQAPLAIWSVRAVTGEYRSGLIHTTLAAVPRRGTVLMAKSTVAAALGLAAGTVTVVGGLLITRAIPTADRPALTSGPTLRAACSSILCLALISVLATGIAIAVRSSAASTAVVLGLLYLFPLAAQLAGSPSWQRRLHRIGPTTSGLPVLAAWVAASLSLGCFLFHARDS
jgi:ABC-2 type transport system permease protein